MKPVLALDVDLTVVDSLTPWLNWIKNVTGSHFQFVFGDKHDNRWVEAYHQMPEYFKNVDYFGSMDLEELTHEMMAYWKQPDLYMNMAPLPSSVSAVHELSQTYEVVFVSHCISEHTESKKQFLRAHFGRHIPLIDASAKEFIDYDVIVDDTPSVINRCKARNPDRLHITFQGVAFKVFMAPGFNKANFGQDVEDAKIVHASQLPGHNVTFSWFDTVALIKSASGKRHLSKTERDMFKMLRAEEVEADSVTL